MVRVHRGSVFTQKAKGRAQFPRLLIYWPYPKNQRHLHVIWQNLDVTESKLPFWIVVVSMTEHSGIDSPFVHRAGISTFKNNCLTQE